SFFSQETQPERVEGADGQAFGETRVNQLAYPLAHFPRSLVGEGHGHHIASCVTTLAQKVGNLLRDYASLPAACTCQYQTGPIQVEDGLALHGVEINWHSGTRYWRDVVVHQISKGSTSRL